MHYLTWRDSHVEQALGRFQRRTAWGLMGVRPDRRVLEEAHRLATVRLRQIARYNIDWGFDPIAFLINATIGYVLDEILDRFPELSRLQKFCIKTAIEILIGIVIMALVAPLLGEETSKEDTTALLEEMADQALEEGNREQGTGNSR